MDVELKTYRSRKLRSLLIWHIILGLLYLSPRWLSESPAQQGSPWDFTLPLIAFVISYLIVRLMKPSGSRVREFFKTLGSIVSGYFLCWLLGVLILGPLILFGIVGGR